MKQLNTIFSKQTLAMTELEEDKEPLLMLVFQTQSGEFTTNIENIIEVIESPQLTPLPIHHHGIHGIINLRGHLVPVVNWNHFYPKKSENSDQVVSKYLIILEPTSQENFGILVESVRKEIVTFENYEGRNKNDDVITLGDGMVRLFNVDKLWKEIRKLCYE
jgi:chemotaxis signal transduction protein